MSGSGAREALRALRAPRRAPRLRLGGRRLADARWAAPRLALGQLATPPRPLGAALAVLLGLTSPGRAPAQVETPAPGASSTAAVVDEATTTRVHLSWAGHQCVRGRRWVPILGPLATRTDSYVLARVVRQRGALVLEQRTCRMDFAPVAGARFAFDRRALPHLPVAQLRFYPRAAGLWRAAPWVVGWGAADDLEGDGQPGARIEVTAPLCSGALQVASRAVSVAQGRLLASGGLVGQIAVTVTQRILAASGLCLRAVAHDSREQLSGFFAYAPVAATATCAGLLAQGWPVRAPESADQLRRLAPGAGVR